jgi:PAS domain S-box-containing protein
MTDILENTSDGFFAVDQDWKFTLVNRQAEKLLDRRRQDLIGKDF